jgi:hypothetical protein
MPASCPSTAVAAFVAGAIAASASAQCLPDSSFAPAARGEWFGAAAAIHGDWAAVAATRGGRNGQVYPLRSVGGRWVVDSPIDPPPEMHGGVFGATNVLGSGLAVADGHLIAGARDTAFAAIYAAPAPGSDQWTLQAQFELPSPTSGCRVAMMTGADAAGRAAIAAPSAPSGALVIVRHDAGAWLEEARFSGPGGAFGASVAAHGDIVVVGEPGLGGGRAHVYQRGASGWHHAAELSEPVPEPLGYGAAVAVRDDVLAVSASAAIFGSPVEPNGRVFIYRRSGAEWRLEATLEDGWHDTWYGLTLAFAGEWLAVEWAGSGGIPLYAPEGGEWRRIDVIPAPARLSFSSFAADPGHPARIIGGEHRNDAAHIYSMAACYCRADITGDGLLDVFDFLAFQWFFVAGDLSADFDGSGSLDFFDFLAFQREFAAGCP